MSITIKEKETIKFYDDNAKAYSDRLKSKNIGFFLPNKAKLFKRLLPEGKLLEIGCGVGNEARLLIEYGYEYTGIDASEGMINQAKKFNPNSNLLVLSVYDVDTLEESYDGFWANLSLVHIPKKKVFNVLLKIKNIVKEEGVGYLSLKAGELEGVDPRGRFFSHYNKKEFTEILNKVGFSIEDSELIIKGDRKFLSFIVRV